MNAVHKKHLVTAFAVALLVPAGLFAQQVPLPKTAAEVPGPTPGTAMTKAYVQSVGRMAYIWGYAMVNSHKGDARTSVQEKDYQVPFAFNGKLNKPTFNLGPEQMVEEALVQVVKAAASKAK